MPVRADQPLHDRIGFGEPALGPADRSTGGLSETGFFQRHLSDHNRDSLNAALAARSDRGFPHATCRESHRTPSRCPRPRHGQSRSRASAFSADAHRRTGACHPADLRMKNLAREAALAQVRIAVKILGGLHDAGGNALALQHHHDLMRRVAPPSKSQSSNRVRRDRQAAPPARQIAHPITHSR